MQKEFVVVVSSHRKLGEMLLPYLVERKAEQTFFQLALLLTTEDLKKIGFTLTDAQQQIIKLASEYSDQSLFKLFSKKKNLKDFFEFLDADTIVSQIRPFIEKRMIKLLPILVESGTPVYVKEKNYQVVHEDERIQLVTEPALPVFNFVKTETEFRYFLSIRLAGKDIKLTKQPYVILSQKPCVVLLGRKLLQVENVDAKKLLPFFTKDHILVPPAREKDYMQTFVRTAIASYPVKAVGFKITEPEVERKVLLSLEPNLKNEPVFILKFQYGSQQFSANSPLNTEVAIVEDGDSYQFLKICRDTIWENQYIQLLAEFGIELTEGASFQYKYFLPDTVPGNQWFDIINWLNKNKEKLSESGFVLTKIKHNTDYYTGKIDLDFVVKTENDWFDVNAKVVVGGFEFPFKRFRKHIISGIREFVLPNDQVMILPREWFSRYREIFVYGNEDEDDTIRLQKHHFQVIKEVMGVETSDYLNDLSQKFEQPKNNEFIVPNGLKATLREYQRTGVNWMYQLYENNLGGVLADDMGLGKTLQTITLLLKVKDENSKKLIEQPERKRKKKTSQLNLFDIPAFTGVDTVASSLIVMPVSLIHNWEAEIKKFAPNLRVYKFMGTQRSKMVPELLDIDVVLASYGVVRNDIESLKNVCFNYVILDESQSIKNPDSKLYKAVVQLQSDHKLVLTGTPIENSLTDLWAQLNFLNRDFLKSLHYFREEFVLPIEKCNDESKQKKLQALINPFILRRKKEQVVKELPSLTEQTMYCEMTEEQQKVYETEKSKIRNMIFENIEKKGFEKSSILILKGLNMLRLMACHPVLSDADYAGESGKFDALTRSLENIVEEKHKVLIFSSYVKHLTLVRSFIEAKGWKYSLLTGATKDRAKVIDAFQTDEENRIFLISLKAGGTGLNLTAADYVFILDPWWNPASENQAIARAHRIGQDKKVFVYRFLSTNTIEEKINQMQQKKSAMADLFINNNNPFRTFGRNEIEDLFR